MRINNLGNNLSFTHLKLKRDNNVLYFEDFLSNGENKYSVEFSNQMVNDQYEICFFSGDEPMPLADEQLILNPEDDILFVASMFTDSSYEQRGLGKSMHLMNIVEMLENDISCIRLNAIPSSIPFHVKMGFKPSGDWEANVMPNVISIANNNDEEFREYKAQARKLLLDNSLDDYDKEKLGNQIILYYAIKANEVLPKTELLHLFKEFTPMQLSRNDVIANGDFYNRLFDALGIDYHIS